MLTTNDFLRALPLMLTAALYFIARLALVQATVIAHQRSV